MSKILFDSNGSGIIYVMGIGFYVPAEKHDETMTKWQTAQTENEALKAENEALKAQLASVVTLTKELAHSAFWAASDLNRADRDSDGFDNDVREQFERHWSAEDKDKLLPEMCVAYIKAKAGRAGFIEGATHWNACDAFNNFVSPEKIEEAAYKYGRSIERGTK